MGQSANNPPLSIAVLLHGGAGGSGVVATETGLRFAREGHDVHFVANRVPFRLMDRSEPNVWFHQVETLAYPLFDAPLTTLAEASKLAEVIETHRIDVIHAHYAIPHATAAILARGMVEGPKPRVVTTLHGTDVTLVGMDRAYLRATRHAIHESDVVTAVSEFLRQETIDELGVKRRIEVVPNAVDVTRFHPGKQPAIRARYATPDEFLLLHVSNFRPLKRVCDVVRTLANINTTHPTQLVMIGDGPEQPKAASLAAELGVRDRVHFLGAFPKVEDIMRTADAFMLVSEHEAFGLAALEAMASGVPVVASQAGGLREVVEDGETGFLRETRDVSGYANALRTLFDDPNLRHRMAVAARRRAETVFSEDDVFASYLRLYREPYPLPQGS